jgi:hypothetical protein
MHVRDVGVTVNLAFKDGGGIVYSGANGQPLIRMLATGEIRIDGIPRNPLRLLRFTRLVSVRE